MELQSDTGSLAHGLLQDPGAVPLVIAVAGHRDPRLEFLPLLRQNFRIQLESLIRTLPHTPLLMLNGLAEGMDSETATVFLDVVAADRQRRGSTTPHHQLVAALPKTPLEYRTDFEDPDALAELERLLASCDGILHPGNCEELRVPTPATGDPRNLDPSACYGQQGIFLVRHCYLLFSFFDGIETRLVGGTSQTVSMQRGEIHPLFVSVEEVLATREPGALVIHHTPRRKQGSPAVGAGEVQFWWPGDTQQGSDARGLEFPEGLLVIPLRLESLNAAAENCPPQQYNPAEGRYTKLWSLADRIAGKQKKVYEKWCRLLVITGFVLVLLAQLSPVAQGLFWALLLLAFVFFPRLQQGPKLRFIGQRCLAECLTVQHLWIALDINDDAADLFHTRSNSEMSWIRTVLRAVRIQLLSFHAHEPRINSSAMHKASIWINDQVNFLTKKIRLFDHLNLRWQITALILAAAAVVLATLGSLPGSEGLYASWVVVLLAGFASSLAYSNLMGYADTADRYRRSLRQFERGQAALSLLTRSESDDPRTNQARQRLVIEAVGREKVDELNDWVAGQLERVYAPGA
jgi:hypothetical protein